MVSPRDSAQYYQKMAGAPREILIEDNPRGNGRV
jgi:hypothetical protein